MKKLLIIILVFVVMLSNVYAVNLIDISDHWARESIYRLVESDSINGYEDNTFKPDNDITVAEFLKILVQYADLKKVLNGERWPDWYINTAMYYNYISENDFDDYNKLITRSEVAGILSKFIGLENIKKVTHNFNDTSDSEVLKLAEIGVVKGYEDNTFRGNNNITRAEASVIICRAMKARRELVAHQKYNIIDSEKLTNINKTASYNSDYENRYEIKNNKLYFYDNGRYANLNGTTIDDIDNEKIINLIKSLIQEDAYVAVNYMPDNLLYDKIVIDYGKREGYVYSNSYTFSFVFYLNEGFNLRKSSLNDELSEKCFLKIETARMWKDVYDLKNGEYAHELNNEKLYNAIKTIFHKKTAIEIYNYIQEWIPRLYKDGFDQKIIEIKKIGKYVLNLYTTGNSRVQVYISK